MLGQYKTGAMNKGFALAFLFCFVLPPSAWATRDGLLDETMIHPLDSFTADTLPKGAFDYNQAIVAIPLPWVSWGMTRRVTLTLDAVSTIGGPLVYHRLIPNVNLRALLGRSDTKKWSWAYETSVISVPSIDQADGAKHLRVVKDGFMTFQHLNTTYRPRPDLGFHAAAGVTFIESVLIENKNRPAYHGKHITNEWSPDVSAAVEWRKSRNLSLHLGASYGSTFVYMDLVPRKVQVIYGLRWAPSPDSSKAFWRNLRVEVPGFFMMFPQANERWTAAVWMPTLYWQWGGK